MAYTVIRTARSEIIKDVMDYSAALCDARGRMIAQAKTIAQHLGAIPDAMASVLARVHRRSPARRRGGHERPLRGRHAHPGRLPLHADLRGRGARGLRGGDRAPDRHGRARARLQRERLHRDLPGGPAPAARSSSTSAACRAARSGASSRRTCGCPTACSATWAPSTRRARWASASCGELFARYGARRRCARYTAELLDYAERLTRAEIARWPRGTYTLHRPSRQRRLQRRAGAAHRGHHRARRRAPHLRLDGQRRPR